MDWQEWQEWPALPAETAVPCVATFTANGYIRLHSRSYLSNSASQNPRLQPVQCDKSTKSLLPPHTPPELAQFSRTAGLTPPASGKLAKVTACKANRITRRRREKISLARTLIPRIQPANIAERHSSCSYSDRHSVAWPTITQFLTSSREDIHSGSQTPS